MQRFYFLHFSHHRLLFFIRPRSPLRSLTENKSLRHDSRKFIASKFIEPTIKEMGEENTLFCVFKKKKIINMCHFGKHFLLLKFITISKSNTKPLKTENFQKLVFDVLFTSKSFTSFALGWR